MPEGVIAADPAGVDVQDAMQQALLELRAAHRRLADLQSITASLSQALTVEDVATVVTSEVARCVGAARSTIAVPASAESLRLLAHGGLSSSEGALYAQLPVTAALPLVDAYRTGQPIWLTSPAEIAARYPDLIDRTPSRSAACVPVAFDGRVLGVMSFGFLEERAFAGAEKTLLEDLSRQVAGALERARLHDEVRVSHEQLQQANRRKDEFMAVLGHELRNPLAPMLTALQVMKLRGDRTCERERALIERQIMYVSRLVDDLLDVSRITRGKLELRKAAVELAAVLAQAIELASPIIQQRHHRLVVDVPTERFLVQADSVRLAQALANLLTNAAKYTDAGGLITVRLVCRGSDVILTIADDGIGIPAELLTDIFEPFMQVERTMERSQGGLGLGLTLVKTLVELHGGSVWASSAGPGRGSEFHVCLPAMPAGDPGTAEDPSNDDRRTREGKTGRRVLVVDDNPDGADSLAEVLRLLGHDADVAYDGRSAVAKAVNDAFDLVLLDINMPGIDGYEVARRIRAEAPGAHRFVAMTGFGTEEDHARSRNEGFIAHLVKPIDYDRLMGILENL